MASVLGMNRGLLESNAGNNMMCVPPLYKGFYLPCKITIGWFWVFIPSSAYTNIQQHIIPSQTDTATDLRQSPYEFSFLEQPTKNNNKCMLMYSDGKEINKKKTMMEAEQRDERRFGGQAAGI